MTSTEILILGQYVEISEYRLKTFLALSRNKCNIPSKIAKTVDIRANHISKVLHELVTHNLIECINQEARKGRLYRLTPIGVEVKKYLLTQHEHYTLTGDETNFTVTDNFTGNTYDNVVALVELLNR